MHTGMKMRLFRRFQIMQANNVDYKNDTTSELDKLQCQIII